MDKNAWQGDNIGQGKNAVVDAVTRARYLDPITASSIGSRTWSAH
jgi:hypothetical protein